MLRAHVRGHIRMKLKYSLLIIFSLLLQFSANSYAGRQGISFYYGLGMGGEQSKDLDVTALGEAVFGIEEDGWLLEATGFASTEAGTSDPDANYSIQGYHFGIGYRTIERNDSYFKFLISRTKMDFNFTDDPIDEKTDGTSYSLGMGWRVDRGQRLEAIYTYYDEDFAPVHMITVRYLWGGTPYHGKSF